MPPAPPDFPIQLRGIDVELMPERAIFLPGRETLVVADLHLGKSAALSRMLPGVPPAIPAEDLNRLAMAIARKGAARLLILGDLIHSKSGRHEHVFSLMRQWRHRFPDLEVILIRGNHDHRAGDPPGFLGFRCVEAPLADDPFLFAHEPFESDRGFVVAGHLHPAVRLRGPGRQGERLGCFLVTDRHAVLPAFGSLTGAKSINPEPGSRVFVTTDHLVLEAGVEKGRRRPA